MLDRVIYISGVHCSGKSTLVQELVKNERLIEHRRIHQVILQDTYIRAVWRLTKYYIEAREQVQLSENSTSIVLGNRCVYDNFAYMNAFLKLGLVSEDQMQHHQNVYDALFPIELRPKHIVHLAPRYDWVRDRLQERWKTNEKKWHEDDFEYLKEVINAFDEWYAPFNVLRIEETNLTRTVELVIDWLRESGLLAPNSLF